MSYVDKNLMSGENVVHKGSIHWFIYVPGAFFVFSGVCLFFVGTGQGTGPIFGVLALSIGLFWLIKAFIMKISTELAVTSKRIIAKVGLIRRNTIELNHQKVESMNIDQSIMGRIFNFGTLIINGTGGGKTPIPSIAAPLEFRKKAMETIDQE